VRKSSVNDLEVGAGKNEGVVKGTEFAVFSEENPSSQPIGLFFATSVTPTTCRIALNYRHSTIIPFTVSYAVVTRWKSPDAELAIFIASGAGSTSLSEVLSPTRLAEFAAPFNIIRTSSSSDADIVLNNTNGTLYLTRTDRLIGVHAAPHIQASVGGAASSVLHLLRSAAQFKFHLTRAYTSNFRRSCVKMELSQLKESDDGRYVPASHNFIQGGRARIILNDEPYGLTLGNKSDRDLFPSLFYFDPSDYSIQPWYTPSSMVSPLRSKSDLKVGHGNQDGHVIKFTLRPGELSDTGFLVLYLSDQYDDMSYLQQDSAFEAVLQAEVAFDRSAPWKVVNDLFRSTAVTIITVARRAAFETNPPASRSCTNIPPYSFVLFLLSCLFVACGLLSLY
jgi:hypothetical protein